MIRKKTGKMLDGQFGKFLIEVKNNISATRTLKNFILDISYELLNSNKEAILLLTDPRMTKERIEIELEKLKKIIRPEIVDRLIVIVYENKKFITLGRDINFDIKSELIRFLPQLVKKKGFRLNPTDINFELLKVMIYQLFNNKGPLTTEWLAKKAIGCSYPPVAKALKNLGNYVKRYSDRRVELGHFPKAEWNKLLVMSDRVRSTINFTDVSGQPRTPDLLLEKIRGLKRTDIGVGGVFGSIYYYPELNISGSHRLDISIHSQNNEFDPEFIEYLDPGLKKTNNPDDPVHLAVHFLRRKEPFFTIDQSGEIWADPVECLLDLHEAHLESQAEEFLNHMLLKGEK